MDATATHGRPPAAAHPTVVMCYRLLDLSARSGIPDFTEGIYADCGAAVPAARAGETPAPQALPRRALSRAAYLHAQWRQSEYLLDEIRCLSGSHILDIGCGNGRLLEQAEARGAQAVGITISEEQVARCRRRRLDARLLNYRNLPPDWAGAFDGLVANGSLEHFVLVEDAAAGRDGPLYEEFFTICRRLVSAGCRLATTAIHFRRAGQVRPEDMRRGPYAFDRSDPRYHFAMVLERTFGGWYPAPGQLESSARGRFRLVREVDGTRDYDRTSQYWLHHLKRSLLTNPVVWAGLAGKLLRYPQPARDMLRCLLVDQSWPWQFRGDPAPTVLLRHTWEAV